MKNIIVLQISILIGLHGTAIGQSSTSKNKQFFHALCFEFWGTSNAYNLQYFYNSKIKQTSLFYQADAIAGYRYNLQGNHELVHAYNISTAINLGYKHNSGRSILLGLGLGYDKGRISFSQDKTNKSIVVYFRLNYARRILQERLILGVSLIYGKKIIDYYNGLDPSFNRRVNEFQNWLAPAVSIGYCFGKKYFQKEKIGTE
jgi:hypothetical protein